MRPVLLIPALLIAPLALTAFLKTITGDSMSAVVLGLIIFVSVAAWFAGPTVTTSRAASGRE